MHIENTYVALALLAALLVGCQSLEEQMTKDDATPAGSKTGTSSTQPGRVMGLEPGWELAPSAKYAATQSNEEVTIRATGEHPSAGYETKLVQSPLRIWPPQWMLGIKKPDGPAATVMTPFEATASFKAKEPVQTVSVRDGEGLHKVSVTQVGSTTNPTTP